MKKKTKRMADGGISNVMGGPTVSANPAIAYKDQMAAMRQQRNSLSGAARGNMTNQMHALRNSWKKPPVSKVGPGVIGGSKVMAPPQLGGGQFGANGGETAPKLAPPQLGGGQLGAGGDQSGAVSQQGSGTVNTTAPVQDFAQKTPSQTFAPTSSASNTDALASLGVQPGSLKRGGVVKRMASGGMVRGAGCASRGIGRALSMNNSAKGRSKGKK